MFEIKTQVYGIVRARGTDGFALVNQYEDGSQSQPWGWFPSVESIELSHGACDIPLENWVQDEDDEGNQ